MQLKSYLLSLAGVFGALLPTISFGECLYCDSWRAFDGNPYFNQSIATLDESTIALPSCEAVSYKIAKSQPSRQYGEACTDHFLELQTPPTCKRIDEKLLRPFVLVTACPRTQWGNEELAIDMTQRPEHPVNASGEFYGASWQLIRKSYEPCDSGGGHGQWMCAKFRLDEAEERLLGMSKGSGDSSYQEWILARDRKCSRKGDGFSESWAYRSEELCKLRQTESRIATLRRQDRRSKKE